MNSAPDRDRGLRARTLGVAAVWAVAVIFLAVGNAFPPWHEAPIFAILAAAFLALWFLWLLRLLQRLNAKG